MLRSSAAFNTYSASATFIQRTAPNTARKGSGCLSSFYNLGRKSMCILGLAINAHPQFPFVCLHNRDEVYGRPTNPVKLHPNGVLCGIDGQSGGTWMGLNTFTGAFAALTNCREPDIPASHEAISRGALVMDALTSKEFTLEPDASNNFEGYNLVTANLFDSVGPPKYWSNRRFGQSTPSSICWNLGNGVHVVSNSTMNDDSWPKVDMMMGDMQVLMQNIGKVDVFEDIEKVADLLSASLLRHNPVDVGTGKGAEQAWIEHLKTSAYISSPLNSSYGTRTQTVVLKSSETGTIHYLTREVGRDPAAAGAWHKFNALS